jgi:lysozyme family protein
MDFQTAIDRVLSSEGGYVNDPRDPGGETQWGISKRSYPMLNIGRLTRADAIAIYRRDFWDKSGADRVHEDIGFQALDFAVNSGCDTAIRYMQRVAGVAEDGHVGEVTLKAINSMSPFVFVVMYLALRLDYMTRLKNWDAAGKGWVRRISDNMMYAVKDFLQ